jgi:hypothetical protein
MKIEKAILIKEAMSNEFLARPYSFQKSASILEGFQIPVRSNLINGVGITIRNKSYALKVLTQANNAMNKSNLAEYFNIEPSDLIVHFVGKIKSRQINTKIRHRPALSGTSIGNVSEDSAGTFGCVVTDSDKFFILSNNHVIALANQAKIGDLIVQPGPLDLARISSIHVIGRLDAYIKIDFSGQNNVDAALARISKGISVFSKIPNIGKISGITSPKIGMKVVKYGRTTNYTSGIITSRNIDIRVNYSSGDAFFIDQFEIFSKDVAFSREGDSGSIIIEEDTNKAVGLLFAGAPNGITYANPINDVLTLLGVDVV